MHRKLENFANQYYKSFKSESEQQRNYYEARLREMRQEYDQKCKKSSAADLIQQEDGHLEGANLPPAANAEVIIKLTQKL